MPGEPEPLRDRLLEAAIRILGDKGGAGLTIRAVATAAECSTMGVYTHFSGKPGLLDAIIEEGFQDFDRCVSQAIDGIEDGRERLLAGAVEYREWALVHSTQYQVMFTPSVPGYERNDAALERGAASFSLHRARVVRALERGDIPGSVEDADLIATHIWTTCHGHVMLALLRGTAAHAEPERHEFRTSMRWAIDGVGAVGAPGSSGA
ncbi:TetR/AcrR family transcriptional regulator [Demequina activiva]|uniref:HTH tetR-type domain-containing protein n=1 Tax=Demequina activiva TaxID=1582364 RepID=A0A919Q2C9_9MICO|nr:TetR/AcrR family transcriptional regulator [Demequina activiva]GIG54952.1 hypothetical protein Dac01nite_17040 [Demequina activiva]